MDVGHPTFSQVQSLSFKFYTTEEIKRLSVKQITNPELFDQLNHPTKNGLYDSALGPFDKRSKCSTCSLNYFTCPGHCGHIELCVPVFNPIVFPEMYRLLRSMCHSCHHFRMPSNVITLFMAKLKLISVGLVSEAADIEKYVISNEIDEKKDIFLAIQDYLEKCLATLNGKSKSISKSILHQNLRKKTVEEFLKKLAPGKCPHCKSVPLKFRKDGFSKIFYSGPATSKSVDILSASGNIKKAESNESTLNSLSDSVYMSPHHIWEHFRLFWEKEKTILGLIFGNSGYKMFFLEAIPVAPTKFRPPSVMGDQTFDHAQNGYLSSILRGNQKIIDMQRAENFDLGQYVETSVQLQNDVNALFDSTKNTSVKGNAAPAGIKQILEKKEGLFRQNMMGKRVNYAARSVISPDPNIETSEIGIPMVFAQKLTYPEPVTNMNVHELRNNVINGPDEYPGATYIQNEDGSMISLMNFKREKRMALANQLLTPSASESSSNEAFLNKKVFRHLKNGDVLLVNRQPTLHKPSIMAHTAKVLKGEKTIRMHYANCNTYNADFDGDEMNLHFPQNEIARAEAYLIANTNNQYLVPTDGNPLRGLIQDHVVTGVLMTARDTFFTREEYHQVLYGCLPETCRKILTLAPALIKPKPMWTGKQVISTVLKNLTVGRPPLNLESKARTPARMWEPFPEESKVVFVDGDLVCGVLDKSQFGASAFGLVHSCYELYGPDIAGKLLTCLGRLFTKYLQSFAGFTCRMDDLILKKDIDEARKTLIKHDEGIQVSKKYASLSSLEGVLRSDDKMKGLDAAMKVMTGRLTSKIIDVCLPKGQARPFPQNNMSLMTVSGAKGSNVNFSQISGLLGQQELEGRRVPTMVSGRSLPSFKPYEWTARSGGYITQRFLTGIKPQEYFFHCMAGREGLVDTAVKTSRSGYLQRCLIKHLEGLLVRYDHTVRDADDSVLQFHYGEDSLDVIKQKYLNQFKFYRDNFQAIMQKLDPINLDRTVTKEARKLSKKAQKHPDRYDPVLSILPPGMHLGSISEKFHTLLEEFIDSQIENDSEAKQFRALMWLNYMKSVVDPGEAVGIVAAQSIGEPSTQMTLNTFHFAGFGAKNVTLGIPRLREIVMTASRNIKTPSMSMSTLKKDISERDVLQICMKFSRIIVANTLQDIRIEECICRKNGARIRDYTISLEFLNENELQRLFDISLQEIEDIVTEKLTKRLLYLVKRSVKKSDSAWNVQVKATANNSEKTQSKSPERDNEDAAQEGSSDDESSSDSEEDEEATSEAEVEDENEISGQPEAVDETETSVAAPVSVARVGNIVKIKLAYPANAAKILMLGIVEQCCKEIVLKQVPGIKQCFPVPDDLGKITTDGVNFRDLWERGWNLLDLNSLYSNDIYAILETYGVEAARAALSKEIAQVFDVYGINVDPRHLSIIADYMTFEGGYKPFNRMGIESNPSPLAKMSFETTFHFLKEATITSDYDDLSNPSAKLVMGQLVRNGTGSFDILVGK